MPASWIGTVQPNNSVNLVPSMATLLLAEAASYSLE
jgi:hypothetical protein